MKKIIYFFGLLFLIMLNVNAIDISACTLMDSVGSTYYLTTDLTDTNPDPYTFCMLIYANDITLDCQGHTINGLRVTNDDGIEIRNRATLKNCVFSDWSTGIKLTNAIGNNLVTIENCSVINSIKHGIQTGNSNLIIKNVSSSYNTKSGIYIVSDYSTSMTNVVASYNNGTAAYCGGISIINGMGGNISNINTSYNKGSGINIADDSTGFYLSNIFATNNVGEIGVGSINTGISLPSNSVLTDFISENNTYGVVIAINYENISINLGRIVNNSYGLKLLDGLDNVSIFNNFFNNSEYFESSTINFNTSYQLGTNIYNPEIGYIAGNFWANQTGGYSIDCVDSNGNGFCDNQYNLSAMNIDYMPISSNFISNTPPQIDYINPLNGSILFNIEDLILEVKVSDYNNDTLTLNISYENNSCYYSGITAGSYVIEWLCDWNFNLEYNKTYNWSVKVDDGVDSLTETYFFSTLSDEFVHVFGVVGGMSNLGFCDSIESATVYLHNLNSTHSYLTYTNIDGSYGFTNLDKGTYYVSVSKEGFNSHYIEKIIYDYGTYSYEDYCLYLEGVNSTWIFNVYDENMSGLINYSLSIWDIYNYEHINLVNNVFNTCSFNCSKITNQVTIENIVNNYFAFSVTHEGFFSYNYLDEFHTYLYIDENYTSYIILRNISNINQCNISGYVTSDLDDSFLEGIHVQIYEHDFFRGNITTTNSDGFFIFYNVSEGLIDLDYKGAHYGFKNMRGYDNYLHICNDKQYNISLNTTYKTKNYNGRIVNCQNILPLQNIKVTLIDKQTNYSIRTSFSDYMGEFTIYNYPSIPENGYYIKFGHNFYQELIKEVNYYQFTEDIIIQDCINPLDEFYNIMFEVTYNNESIDEETEIYLLIEPILISSDISFESTEYVITGIMPFVYLPYGKYKAYVGLNEGHYTNSVEFMADEDKIIYIDIFESLNREILDLFGIPSTEKGVWNWMSSWGWMLFFVIFILFILVIIKNQINELQ